jgi:PAS domain S-box-containing protein
MQKTLLNIVILFFAYFIPGKLGFLLALPPDGSTAIWPSSGFASAGVLLLGYGSLPGVFLGSLFLNLHHKLNFIEIFSPEVFNYLTKASFIALGALLESLSVAYIIKRFIGFPSSFSHWKDIIILFIFAGLIGSIPSPTIGVMTLYMMGYISLSNFLYNWVSWWTGNSLGIIAITPILATIFSPTEYITNKRKVFIAVPIITVVTLVSLSFVNTNKYEQRKLQQDLEKEARNTIVKIENRIQTKFKQISAIDSFYGASNTVSRDEFNIFLKNYLTETNSVYTINWLPKINNQNRDKIIKETKEDGLTGFKIKTLNDTPALKMQFPILYSESANNERKNLGFDKMSDPELSEFLLDSISSGDMFTTPIHEIREEDELLRMFTIYKPIYYNDKPIDTVSNRKKNIAGFISGTYKVNTLMSYYSKELKEKGIEINIFDHTNNFSDTNLIYRSYEGSPEFLLETAICIDVAGRIWTIKFQQTEEYLVANKEWHLWYLLIAGLTLVTFAAILTLIITGYSATIEVLVKKKTRDLAESEQRFQLVVKGTKDGIWDWKNTSTDEQYWSPQFYKLLGYESDELEAKQSTFLSMVSHEDLEAVQKVFNANIYKGRTFNIEHRMKKKSGKLAWFQSRGIIVVDPTTNNKRMTGSTSDISDRKNTEKKLQLAKDEAESATIMKSDFLATMSHEIRTPMNGIIGTTELVLDTTLTSQQKGYLDNVLYSAENLLEILNDILDFSKIEAGKIEIELHPFSIRRASQEVIDLLLPKARQKNLSLTLDFKKNAPEFVIADSMRIRQILHNLVGNAIKFTEEGGVTITVDDLHEVKTAKDKTMLNISVTDTGIGLTKEQRRAIFNKFVQADSSTTRKFGGTGLGLSICQMLVSLLGGEIGVESESGKGSVFSFSILVDITSEDKIDKVIDTGIDALDHGVTTPIRVLMAEDNRINAEFAKEMLEKLKCNVVTVRNGKEAHETLQKDRKFDLIFMDCQMPIMDGFEATTNVLKYEKVSKYDHIPIIALTANAMKGDRERCIEAGMDDYLSKPVRKKDFAGMIRKWLSDK